MENRNYIYGIIILIVLIIMFLLYRKKKKGAIEPVPTYKSYDSNYSDLCDFRYLDTDNENNYTNYANSPNQSWYDQISAIASKKMDQIPAGQSNNFMTWDRYGRVVDSGVRIDDNSGGQNVLWSSDKIISKMTLLENKLMQCCKSGGGSGGGGGANKCNFNSGAQVSTLDCKNRNVTGSLTVGVNGSISARVDYTGGNGGTYSAQTIQSQGVAGLKAILNSGTLNNGIGFLTYQISGTPSNVGSADFVVAMGNVSCIMNIPVNQAAVPHTPIPAQPQPPQSQTLTISDYYGNGGCRQGGIGEGDKFEHNWSNMGSMNLADGNYRLSFTAEFTAKGKVYTGKPTKKLECNVQFRLVNRTTNQEYLVASTGRVVMTGEIVRNASDTLYTYRSPVGASSTVSVLPAGNYSVQGYWESWFTGGGHMGIDTWAGCDGDITNISVTVAPQ